MRHVQESQWDGLILRLPAPHVLQSRLWGQFKSRWGWRCHRLAWFQGRRPVAAAQVLVRRVAGALAVGYVPKGPLVADLLHPEAWQPVLADLEEWARAEGLAWLKIDPDVPAEAQAVAGLWRDRGWRASGEQIQFPNTMVTDLTAGEEALLGAMKSKTRYNIRLARRRGVTVRQAGRKELVAFYDLYAETAARNGFAIRRRAYYLDAWTTFLDAGWAALILAEYQGRPLAGVLPVAFGPTAWFLYGASASQGRELMPAYLAQWESLRWAIGRGCRRYDWWGGPTTLDPSDPLWGVYRFKKGFGAQWVPQLGAWDYPAHRLAWRSYALLARLRYLVLAMRRAMLR